MKPKSPIHACTSLGLTALFLVLGTTAFTQTPTPMRHPFETVIAESTFVSVDGTEAIFTNFMNNPHNVRVFIDAAGRVYFNGRTPQSTGPNWEGLYRAVYDSTSTGQPDAEINAIVVREQAFPGLTRSLFRMATGPFAVSGSGNAVFDGQTQGSTTASYLLEAQVHGHEGVVVGPSLGEQERIDRFGVAAKGRFSGPFGDVRISENGHLAFPAQLIGDNGKSGVFLRRPPAGEITALAYRKTGFTPSAVLGVNDRGDTLVLVKLSGEGITTANDEQIYFFPNGETAVSVVREGDPVPDQDDFAFAELEATMNQNGEILIRGAAVNTKTNERREGFWSSMVGRTPFELFTMAAGDQVETDQGLVGFEKLIAGEFLLAADGDIVFEAETSHVLMNGRIVRGGSLWRRRGSNEYQLLAQTISGLPRSAAPAPNGTSGTFENIGRLAINREGEILFRADLNFGPPSDQGIFTIDKANQLALVARKGEMIGDEVIAEVHLAQGGAVGQSGRSLALNDDGRVVFLVETEEDRQFIIRSRVGVPNVAEQYIFNRGAGDNGWHTIAGDLTNWMDENEIPHTEPPGESGDELVTITEAHVLLDEKAAMIGTLEGNPGSILTTATSLTLNEDSRIDRLDTGADLVVRQSLDVEREAVWRAGDWLGGGEIRFGPEARLSLPNSEERRTVDVSLEIANRGEVLGGPITLGDNAFLDLLFDSEFHYRGGNVGSGDSVILPRIRNAGLINLEAGSDESRSIHAIYDQEPGGRIHSMGGTWDLAGGGMHRGGQYVVDRGSSLRFTQGEFTVREHNLTAVGEGRIVIDGAAYRVSGQEALFDLNGEGAALVLNSGSLEIEGTLHNAGRFDWSGGDWSTVRKGLMENEGIFVVNGTDLKLDGALENRDLVRLLGESMEMTPKTMIRNHPGGTIEIAGTLKSPSGELLLESQGEALLAIERSGTLNGAGEGPELAFENDTRLIKNRNGIMIFRREQTDINEAHLQVQSGFMRMNEAMNLRECDVWETADLEVSKTRITADDARFHGGGRVRILDLTVAEEAHLEVDVRGDFRSTKVHGTLVNRGSSRLGPASTRGEEGTILNHGTLFVESPEGMFIDFQPRLENHATVIQGTDQRIDYNDVLNLGDFELRGHIVSAGPSNRFENRGTLLAGDGRSQGLATISQMSFDNQNVVRVGEDTTLRIDTIVQTSGNVLTGGEWDTAGVLELGMSGIHTNQGSIRIRGDGSLTNLPSPGGFAATFVNASQGIFHLSHGAHYESASDICNEGVMVIGDGCTLKANGNFVQKAGELTMNGTLTAATVENRGGRFQSFGRIIGTLINGGTVAPGNSPGVLTVDGYTQTAAGTLQIEIAGPDQGVGYDHLLTHGPMSLDGALELCLLHNYLPAAGESFTILKGESVTGTFDSVHLQGVSGRVDFEVVYGADSVTLVARPLGVTTYEAWQALKFPLGGEEALPNADPDGDELDNLLEYALATRPGKADLGMLKVGLDDSGRVRLSFPWAIGMTDVLPMIESSTDLRQWRPAGVQLVERTEHGGVEERTYQLIDAEAEAEARLFLRLSVGFP